MADLNEIDALLAKANQLALRKFGTDMSGDPKIDKIVSELAEAAVQRTRDRNWSVEHLYMAVTEVAAERIVALESKLAKLKEESK